MEIEEKILFQWEATLRPYKKRSPILIRFFIAITLITSAIVVFFGDLITLMPLWAILFLFYVFAVTPPPRVTNKLTSFGIESNGVFVRWENLSHFYFVNRLGSDVLTVVSHPPYNAHLYFVLPDTAIKQQVFAVLSEHCMYLSRPPQTFTDRVIKYLSTLIPHEAKGLDPHTSNTTSL